MSLSPWLRSPFTDLTGAMVSNQWFGECRDMEMRLLDCLEAYGLGRGIEKCEVLMMDFQECVGRKKQRQRIHEMRRERMRQYLAGERSKEDAFAPGPKADSY